MYVCVCMYIHEHICIYMHIYMHIYVYCNVRLHLNKRVLLNNILSQHNISCPVSRNENFKLCLVIYIYYQVCIIIVL